MCWSRALLRHLPEGEPIFSEDDDGPINARACAEIVREKVLRVTGDEIPYVTAVVTERFEEIREDFARIFCVIVVEQAHKRRSWQGRESFEDIGIRAQRDRGTVGPSRASRAVCESRRRLAQPRTTAGRVWIEWKLSTPKENQTHGTRSTSN